MILVMLHSKRTLLSLMLAASAAAQNPRIEAVENGLTPGVVVKGHAPAKRTIAERMKAYHVPGVSVAVVHDYRLEWAKGYGVADRSTNTLVDAGTLFQAASISKPVAAAAALQLVEQKKLSLDEDVNQRLRTWKVPENGFTRTEKVTLRRILSHSAGLTVHGFPGYAVGAAIPSLPEILDGRSPANTPAIRVDVTPGSIWRYSGGGFTVMQMLLTDVTGEAFPALMQRLVLGRAGMERSTYQQPLPEAKLASASAGHNSAGAPIPGKRHTYPEMAAAGLWTTPSDLARFGIEIQKAREGRSAMLSKESASEMLRVQNGSWGLGFELRPDPPSPRFLHGGANEGFRAQAIFGFDGEGAVVMTNSDSGSDLANEIVQSVAAAYGWRNLPPREKEAVTLDGTTLAAFAGTYQWPQAGMANMRVEGDHLVVSCALFSEIEYYPASPTKFFPLAGALPEITFQKNERGEVTGASGGGMQAVKLR